MNSSLTFLFANPASTMPVDRTAAICVSKGAPRHSKETVSPPASPIQSSSPPAVTRTRTSSETLGAAERLPSAEELGSRGGAAAGFVAVVARGRQTVTLSGREYRRRAPHEHVPGLDAACLGGGAFRNHRVYDGDGVARALAENQAHVDRGELDVVNHLGPARGVAHDRGGDGGSRCARGRS